MAQEVFKNVPELPPNIYVLKDGGREMRLCYGSHWSAKTLEELGEISSVGLEAGGLLTSTNNPSEIDRFMYPAGFTGQYKEIISIIKERAPDSQIFIPDISSYAANRNGEGFFSSELFESTVITTALAMLSGADVINARKERLKSGPDSSMTRREMLAYAIAWFVYAPALLDMVTIGSAFPDGVANKDLVRLQSYSPYATLRRWSIEVRNRFMARKSILALQVVPEKKTVTFLGGLHRGVEDYLLPTAQEELFAVCRDSVAELIAEWQFLGGREGVDILRERVATIVNSMIVTPVMSWNKTTNEWDYRFLIDKSLYDFAQGCGFKVSLPASSIFLEI